MNRRRLFAKVMALVLSVVLVFGVVSVAAAAANPSATISPANHVFPSAVVGYGEQAAQVFTITNTGDVNLWPAGFGWTGDKFRGEGPYGEVYHDREGVIQPGQSRTFTLRPDTNLPIGTHIGEFTGWFWGATDLNERHRILNEQQRFEEGESRLLNSYIAMYLRVARETLDAWGDAEWEAFWVDDWRRGDGGFFNSPEGRQWEAARVEYWRSLGRIEVRATFSFTVTATPPIAVPDDDASENIAHQQYDDTATTATPDDDVGGETDHDQYDDINEDSFNINLNPPTGR